MTADSRSFSERLERDIVPPVFVVGFTLVIQIFAVLGTTREDVTWSIFGNGFSWKAVLALFLWAFASLWIPGKEYKGPTTSFGYTPVYKSNGLQFFVASFLTFITLLFVWPQLAEEITINFPQILATCNIIALLLCVYLLHKGKTSPEAPEKLEKQPLMYEFYRGMELHPRLLGVDVKQLTNCRFGLMAWFLLVVNFFVYSCITQGFSLAFLVCVILQTVYMGKFYWWETGYFNTIDMIFDRAGYYICWGCIVWVPCLFTFSSYYLCSRPVLVSDNAAWLILVFGLLSTTLNYWVDWEKEYFRQHAGKCRIWGRTAKFLVAPYKTNTGAAKKSQLLISGFWGQARHLNYVFETMVAISWSLPTMGYGIWTFLYPIFIGILLVHRVFRDEKKCKEKYGPVWTEYCQKVPYRMIPGIF